MKSTLVLFCLTAILFTSCSGGAYNELSDDRSYVEMNTYTANGKDSFQYFSESGMDAMWTETEEVYMAKTEDWEYSSVPVSTDTTSVPATENRKLVREASLYMETKEYDVLLSSLEKQVVSAGGYIQSAQSEGNAEYSNRWVYYVLRIPESQYDAFQDTVQSLGTVTSRNENVTDITLTYTDTESRIKALETEYETLITILEKCESLNDVITVQSRITEVTYQLENYKSALRTYDNQVAYCTIRLTISEVQKITASEKNLSIGERMKREIADNWLDLGDDAIDFVIWLVSALPALILFGGVIIIVTVLIRRSCKKRKMKKSVMVPGMMYNVQPVPTANENVENKK